VHVDALPAWRAAVIPTTKRVIDPTGKSQQNHIINARLHTAWVAKRREHSRKPDAVREGIERLVGGPYLELFARETKPGWNYRGNQLALFDQGPVATRRQPSRLVEAPQLPL
jgi:N6-adenosine-specific RNA methylase IME4